MHYVGLFEMSSDHCFGSMQLGVLNFRPIVSGLLSCTNCFKQYCLQ